jgi:hypothetical protein
MVPFSDTLFWDCDATTIDAEKHRRFIIGRVLTRGTMEDWLSLKRLYGHEGLKSEVVQLRSLDPRTLAFCCTYFELNKEDFRCYSKNPSSIPKPAGY